MSTIFGITEDKMKETSSTFTLTEIYQQPATWEKTSDRGEQRRTSEIYRSGYQM